MTVRISFNRSWNLTNFEGSRYICPKSVHMSTVISSTRRHSRRSRIRLYSASRAVNEISCHSFYIATLILKYINHHWLTIGFFFSLGRLSANSSRELVWVGRIGSNLLISDEVGSNSRSSQVLLWHEFMMGKESRSGQCPFDMRGRQELEGGKREWSRAATSACTICSASLSINSAGWMLESHEMTVV